MNLYYYLKDYYKNVINIIIFSKRNDKYETGTHWFKRTTSI